MSEVNLLQQAKQGNITAISSLMNRLLKSQGMMAAVDQEQNCLHILIESDRRSLDDDLRIPNRTVLVAMLKKWFVSLEVQKVSSLDISWQQTGQDAPAWNEVVQIEPPPADEVLSNDETILQEHPASEFTGTPVAQPQTVNQAANITNNPVPPAIVIPSSVDPEVAARNESFDDIFGNDPIGSITTEDNELLQFALEPLPPLPVPEITPPPVKDEPVFMLMDVPTNVPDTVVNPVIQAPANSKVELNVLTTNRDQAASMDTQANVSIIDPAAAEAANVMHQSSESNSESTARGWLHTNSFMWQFGQYLVICAVIIGIVQGLHSALRPPKPDKANRPTAVEMVSRDTVANTAASSQDTSKK